MKILSLLLKALVFLFLLGFAVKNDGMVTVKAFSWSMSPVCRTEIRFSLPFILCLLWVSCLGVRPPVYLNYSIFKCGCQAF